MSRRNIDQRRKERILAEINQVYDEAYELGYQSGRRQNEHDIAYTGDIMAQALKTLKELTEESAEKVEVIHCKDCKHHRGDCPKCELHNGIWWISDFCSRGERKESEEQ